MKLLQRLLKATVMPAVCLSLCLQPAFAQTVSGEEAAVQKGNAASQEADETNLQQNAEQNREEEEETGKASEGQSDIVKDTQEDSEGTENGEKTETEGSVETEEKDKTEEKDEVKEKEETGEAETEQNPQLGDVEKPETGEAAGSQSITPQPEAGQAVLVKEEKELELPDDETLFAYNHTLYLVNCGASDGAMVPDGYEKMGYFQSSTEQPYGEDAVTGARWGYYENGTTITTGRTGSNNTLNDNGRYYYGDAYNSEESGVYYHFQCPDNQTYEVTVGFYIPKWWKDRTVGIKLEGENQGNLALEDAVLTEKTYNVEVTDGELNLEVFSPNRNSSEDDAYISYIIVKVPVTYNQAWLKQAMKNYELTKEDRSQYSRQSLDRYDEAWEYAEKVSEGWGEDSEERILSYYNKLVQKYETLQEKNDAVTYESFTGTNGETWYDDEGTEIQAHGGQVIKFGDTWYWYGEDKTDGYRTVDGGVRVYSSQDLYNWHDEGVALRNLTDKYDFEEDYFKELYGEEDEQQKAAVLLAINDTTSVIERPKVIYNEKNDNYVMWFHADGPTETSTANYAAASAGVAVSDSPAGPFKFVERSRLNYVEGAYDASKGMARDMTLFVDDDGTGYIVYASEENATLFISKLNEDYTGLSADPKEAVEGVDFIRSACFAQQKREAPVLFKYNGLYYMLTSGCTGWGANPAQYATAEEVFGEWTNQGNPCVNDTSICSYTNSTTFGTQPTYMIEVDASKGQFIYMGDRWNSSSPSGNSLIDPKYVWLPAEFGSAGELTLRPYADWTQDLLETLNYKMTVNSDYPKYPDCIESLGDMPDRLNITDENGTYDTPVIWSYEKASEEGATGCAVTLTGSLPEVANGKITLKTKVMIVPDNLVYFVDCGSLSASGNKGTSEGYEMVKEKVEGLLNETADQAYTAGSRWGYLAASLDGAKGYVNGLGLDSTGYYGTNDGKTNVTYKVKLDAGSYRITSGHYEWWNNSRTTDVRVSYEADGRTVSCDIGSASVSGNGDQALITGCFKVPEDNTEVTITFARNASSSQAGVVSYFSIEDETYAIDLNETALPSAVTSSSAYIQVPVTFNDKNKISTYLEKAAGQNGEPARSGQADFKVRAYAYQTGSNVKTGVQLIYLNAAGQVTTEWWDQIESFGSLEEARQFMNWPDGAGYKLKVTDIRWENESSPNELRVHLVFQGEKQSFERATCQNILLHR